MAILERSMDPGKHEEFVQFSTFKKARSALTNFSQACVGGLDARIGSYEKNKLWISNVPTHSFFCSRFMEGIHRRVGDTVKRDEPITIGLLLAIQEHLEAQWCAEQAKPQPIRE